MADDERIARLTELARRVWPDVADYVQIEVTSEEAFVHVGHGEVLLDVAGKGRSLDALEAALLVLVGETLRRESLDDILAGMRAQYGIPDRCEMEPAAPSAETTNVAWIEDLAAEWEREADMNTACGDMDVRLTLRNCAAELRARARSRGSND